MMRLAPATLAGLLAHGSAGALGPSAPFTPPDASAIAAAAAREAPASPAAPPPTAVPALAGVRLGRAPQALIDGRWVALGGRAGDSVLVAVGAHGATLRGADGRTETLPLHPEVQIVRRDGAFPFAKRSPR
jgi:hypothetical protein